MMKSEQEQKKHGWLDIKNWSSFILLAVVFINCLVCTILISKNVVITQENQILLERLVALGINNLGLPTVTPKTTEIELPPHSEQLIGLRGDIQANNCPPCPTPPTDVHLTPVSILNEASFNKAQYDCVHTCVNPPIHSAYLTVDDECCVGKNWTGIGESKQASKHAAAYKALHDKFKDRYDEVAESHVPQDYRPLPCKKPPISLAGESTETVAATHYAVIAEKSKKKPYHMLRDLHNPIPFEPLCVQFCGKPRTFKSNFTIRVDISETTDYFEAYSSLPRSALEKVSYFTLQKLYPSSLPEVEKPEDLTHETPICLGTQADRIVDCKKTTL